MENDCRLVVSGDVTLVLDAGTTLTLPKGIEVPEGSSPTILGEGTLVANADGGDAAIGAGSCRDSYGAITIEGGTIVATGGACGAGIGGGGIPGQNDGLTGGGDVGRISVTGGCVKATGGASGYGIGPGTSSRNAQYDGTCAGITLGATDGATEITATTYGGSVTLATDLVDKSSPSTIFPAGPVADKSGLAGITLVRVPLTGYDAWADANGVSGAWNDTDARGIHKTSSATPSTTPTPSRPRPSSRSSSTRTAGPWC